MANTLSKSSKITSALQAADHGFGMLGAGAIGSIFGMFLKDSWHLFLEQSAKQILFPLAVAVDIVRAVLAIRQAVVDKKTNSAFRAVVETGAAIAVTTAVVFALGFSASLGMFAPYIFTGVLAAKTLIHAGTAIWYGAKRAMATTPEKKEKYNRLIAANIIGTFALGLVTAAIVGVMLFAKPALAPLGIASAGIALTFGAYSLYRHFKGPAAPAPAYKVVDEKEQEMEEVHDLDLELSKTNNASMHQALDSRAAPLATGLDTLQKKADKKLEVVDGHQITLGSQTRLSPSMGRA